MKLSSINIIIIKLIFQHLQNTYCRENASANRTRQVTINTFKGTYEIFIEILKVWNNNNK